ncbi:MAG: hypothetical protein RL386_849 [Bacteroidota bacterium]
MPTVVREDSGNLEAKLSIHIHYADYQKSFGKEISKLQQQAQIKGFRKGKVPLSLVTKMYGSEILSDILNKAVQETLDDYIQKEGIILVGQPRQVINERQEFSDYKNKKDYVFDFEIGFVPDFEVEGVDKSSVLHVAVPEITPEMIGAEVEKIQEKHAVSIEATPPYADKDALAFLAHELESPGNLKPGGHTADFAILFGDATEAAKEAMAHLTPGNSVELDVFSLEKERDEQFVRRYILGINPDETIETGRLFQLELESANRRSPRPIDAEFLAELFGSDEVQDEAALQDFIRHGLKNAYLLRADLVLLADLRNFLLDCNPLPLPDNYLRRQMLESGKNRDPKKIDEALADVAKNLRWSLIQNKIIRDYKIGVSEQDVQNHFYSQISGYLGQFPGVSADLYSNMINRMMQNEEQVNKAVEEILADKVFRTIKAEVTIVEDPIGLDAFLSLVEATQRSLEDEYARIKIDRDEEE